MYTEYEIRQLRLSIPRQRKMVETFLAENGLRLDDVDYYAGIFALDSDTLLAGGGLKAGVIKCIAVSPSLRGETMSNRLVSHLISVAGEKGYRKVKVFTKPENQVFFENLSFRMIAKAPKAVLMETGAGGIEDYCQYLRSFVPHGKEQEKPRGVIVMNANPFTIGHDYLVRTSATQVGHLFVIVVKEDASDYCYTERLSMIREGCKGLPNVSVCEGSDYAISAATFPSYFIKQLSYVAETQMLLDIDIYRRYIAPALDADVRFVGSEPDDALTRRYNELMTAMLPDVRTVERLRLDGIPVSASRVRWMLDKGCLQKALPLVPASTVPFLITHLATQALLKELELTPKPGLVDCHDNGAHSDMDYSLMLKSIHTLHPYFLQLARLGFNAHLPSTSEMQRIGMETESAMMEATGNVNTHRGALFSMGVCVVAAAFVTYGTEGDLQTVIKRIARQIPAAKGTHGSEVQGKYSVKGALANAQEGYRMLFEEWLPFYDSIRLEENACHRLLLRIMSQLDDTNVYHRTDAQTASWVKQQATDLLENFSIKRLDELNHQFVVKNLSPGGSADMLSLTLFIYSIINPNNISLT